MKHSAHPHGYTMRRGLRDGFGVLAAVALLSTFAAPAHAVGYTFTRVVDSTADGFQGFFGCPAMNNAGAITFKAARVDAGVNGIHRANADGSLTTIAENAKKFGFLGNNPSINDLGQVSFAARLRAEDKAGNQIENILRGDDKKLTTIASTADEFAFFVFDTTVNNSGEVAFGAELDNFDEGLFSSQGGKAPTTTHYLASTSQFTGSSGRPSINNLGEIAFDERTDANFDPGIFVTDGAGGFTTILEPAEHFFVDTPQLNDAGTAAFVSDFFDEAGDQYLAVVTGNGGLLTTVADTRGPFSFFGPPSVNNNGDVAFEGELDSAGLPAPEGIFTGPDPVEDRVVGTGDVLDGGVVTDVRMCHDGLNDSGQIAFTAELTDPVTSETRTAIYRATRN